MTKATKGTGAAKAAEASSAVGPVRVLLQRYLALDADERAYFELRQPVDVAQREGRRTVAAAVLPDLVRLTVRHAQARERFPAVAAKVTSAQMRWLCEQVVALGDAIELRDSAGAKTAQASSQVQGRWGEARAVRAELASAMRECAEARPDDAAALKAARGTTEKPDATERSLTALVGVAAGWLGRTDAGSMVAAREASLTAELIDRAQVAAKALRAALDADAAHPGDRRVERDTPEVNTLEGRALLSLKLVRHNHGRARRSDPTVEPVALPESLKKVLGALPRKKKAAAPADGTTTTGEGTAAAEAPRAARVKRRSKRRRAG